MTHFFTFLALAVDVVIWTKIPADPTFGVLGKNITLEWGFNLNLGEHNDFVHCALKRRDNGVLQDIAQYGRVGAGFVYLNYRGKFVLAKNRTPALMLITAEERDETEYCCEVNTQAGPEEKCVHLKILGNAC